MRFFGYFTFQHQTVQNLFESPCGDTLSFTWGLCGCRDPNHHGKAWCFLSPGKNAIAFCCPTHNKCPLGLLLHPLYCQKMFCLRRHVPPKEIKKLFAAVQSSSSSARPRVGVTGESLGVQRFFSPKVAVLAPVLAGERQAPESPSCAGAAGPLLLLACNSSRCRPRGFKKHPWGLTPSHANPAAPPGAECSASGTFLLGDLRGLFQKSPLRWLREAELRDSALSEPDVCTLPVYSQYRQY